jgi:hypothetical protein
VSTGQLANLVLAAPVITAQAVDFRKGTWTFSLPAIPVGPGDYKVVRATDALYALACDQQRPQGVVLPAPAERSSVQFDDEDYGGGQRLRVSGPGLEISAYRDHTPDPGREQYWFGASVWRGREERRDTDGRDWTRPLGHLVCNDFGDLVEVAA